MNSCSAAVAKAAPRLARKPAALSMAASAGSSARMPAGSRRSAPTVPPGRRGRRVPPPPARRQFAPPEWMDRPCASPPHARHWSGCKFVRRHQPRQPRHGLGHPSGLVTHNGQQVFGAGLPALRPEPLAPAACQDDSIIFCHKYFPKRCPRTGSPFRRKFTQRAPPAEHGLGRAQRAPPNLPEPGDGIRRGENRAAPGHRLRRMQHKQQMRAACRHRFIHAFAQRGAI